MSLLSEGEIRYVSISAFGLIIFTTILKWTGIGQTKYNPLVPGTVNASKIGNRSALDMLMEPSLTGGPGSSAINLTIDILLTPIQIVVDQLLMWAAVWDVMGWASVFIIVPMFIMLTIIGSVVVRLLNTIIPG